jgi:hypothetical protein
MKLPLMIFLLLLGCCIAADAQQNYDASLIPKDLLPYASSVVRDQQEIVEVKDVDNLVITIKEAVTVLNKNGDENAHIVIYYNKAEAIKDIRGAIYNGFGKQIGKFSQSDFSDESVADGYSLFDSERLKHYLPAVTEYPYTVVYTYEEHTKQSVDLANWAPVDKAGESIEKSSLTVLCKPDFKIRYKENNLGSNVNVSSSAKGEKEYDWQVSNVKALRNEPFSPYFENFLPSVRVVPEKFNFYGKEGQFTNWNTLGKWEYDNLLAGRQQLPQETIDKIKAMTANISDPKLKAQKVYEYVQSKTHYISVQVGIGGNQPFMASDVDKLNYGDCKALVNYTQALLKAINIDSYYCVVQSGGDHKVDLQRDFASMDQGDHIILCIPFKNDTTWADCTSQTLPFGYLGDFTDDRNVLACTPDGGKLLHTPKYTAEDDLESRKAELVLSTEGAISGNMVTVYKGVDYENVDDLVDKSFAEQSKALQSMYPINNLIINHYELKQDKSFKPSATENIKLQAKDYASFTDGKYFFLADPINRMDQTPKQVMNRHNDVCINRGFTDIDDVTYTIPAGYHSEKDPLNVSIDKPFGKFSATIEQKGDQLIYKRKFQLIDGTYSKETYQELVDFFASVVDADSYEVSLVKN